MQVKAERPAWYLSVICGALLRVIEQVNLRSADYLGFLEKGQLPPARLTLTSFEQQLVLEGLHSAPASCPVSYLNHCCSLVLLRLGLFFLPPCVCITREGSSAAGSCMQLPSSEHLCYALFSILAALLQRPAAT